MKTFQKLNVPLMACLISIGVTGCGGGSSYSGEGAASNSLPTQAPTQVPTQAPTQIPVTEGVRLSELDRPSIETLSEDEVLLNTYASDLDFPEWWRLVDLLPNPELFCEEPTEQKLLELADQLGGFSKNIQIRVERDATAPYDYNDLARSGDLLENTTVDSTDGGVNIQRPNLVGRKDNKVFYLSDIYGLIYVSLPENAVALPEVSCGFPVPGNPKNFVVTDSALYVLTEGTGYYDSAVLEFSLTEESPVFIDGLFFKNTSILDARLFNATLALYQQTYEPVDEDQPQTQDESEVVSGTAADIIDPGFVYEYRKPLNKELKVIDLDNSLTVTHTETLESIENDDGTPRQDDPEATRSWSSFNRFLSASGEYLIVSQSETFSYFDGYLRQTRSICDDWERIETTYLACRPIWKRIENPDYEEQPQSGVIPCTGSLSACLANYVPKIQQYIYVADGQECENKTRVRFNCVASHIESYDVPQYRNESFTHFTIYRFQDGEFSKLENHLAEFDTLASEIIATSNPIRVQGRVDKHDHMHFANDAFYILSSEKSTQKLHTFSVQGNSVVRTSELDIGDQRYADISVRFTSENIYVSSGFYANSQYQSNLKALSLANHYLPKASADISLPAAVEQLYFDEGVLISVGITRIESQTDNTWLNWGAVTLFDVDSEAGELNETGQLLLGTDYRYIADRFYDDQNIVHDSHANRLFLPYSVFSPINTEASTSENRLTIANVNSGLLEEEYTFTLPDVPERTLNISESSVLAFSDQFIHALTNENGWDKNTLLDGRVPESVYFSSTLPLNIQFAQSSGHYSFTLHESNTHTSGVKLDELTLEKAATHHCTYEQVFFDRNRILIVDEPPQTYFDRRDCPDDRSEAIKRYRGYQVSDNGIQFEVIEDQQQLVDLYNLIKTPVYCLYEPEENTTEVSAEDPICYYEEDHQRIQSQN